MATTVVITSYNYGRYIEEAILSVLDQTHPCEIIVVDDGSTDNTRDVCKHYPIRYIYQENQGLPTARNNGIKASTGSTIVCLDADDMLEPTYVEKCLERLYEGVGIVRTGLRHFGDENSVLTPSTLVNRDVSIWNSNNQAYYSAMFPKEAWEKVGGYDEKMKDGYEDWDFWLRIVKTGYKVETVEEPLLLYRKHGKSMIDSSLKKDKELREYIRSK